MRKTVVLKSAAKAMLPFQPQLRSLKRYWRPYTDNPGNSALALAQGLEIIGALKESGANLGGEILEIGSGWLPVIPLLFYLHGSRHVTLTDLERLMDAHTIGLARELVGAHASTVGAAFGLAPAEVARRLAGDFALDYRVPWDATRHPPTSADIIVSRAVFEHVPPQRLERLLDECARILRPGGTMCHLVDNSDHWEHNDKSLSRLDFLRYPDNWWWKLACYNVQSYQNRLRHGDYLDLFARHGWTVTVGKGEADEKCLRDLQSLPLAPAFRQHDRRDLAILTSLFVCRRQNDLPPDQPPGT